MEDWKIEDVYATTLQELKVLNKDLKDIGDSIYRLSELKINIISTIETKVKNIEENYKVKMSFGVKALEYRNLESLKKLLL